jgi:excisionase family DNA binding protein
VKRKPVGFEIDDVPASVLTIDELSGYLKIPKSTLYKLAQEGKLPGQKVGRQWRFHRRAVDDWLTNAAAMAESR